MSCLKRFDFRRDTQDVDAVIWDALDSRSSSLHVCSVYLSVNFDHDLNSSEADVLICYGMLATRISSSEWRIPQVPCNGFQPGWCWPLVAPSFVGQPAFVRLPPNRE